MRVTGGKKGKDSKERLGERLAAQPLGSVNVEVEIESDEVAAESEAPEAATVLAVVLESRHLYNRDTNEHLPFGRAVEILDHPWWRDKAEKEGLIKLFPLSEAEAAHALAAKLWATVEHERLRRLAGNIKNKDGSWAIPEQ